MEKFAALDDDTLAEQAAQGNRQALELLLERFAPLAVRVAYGVLASREDALDAAQTTLIQVANQLSLRWSGKSFRAWFCVCAHGAAVNLAIQNRSRRLREKGAAPAANPAAQPDEILEHNESLRILRDEIAKLPLETSVPLTLHHLEGLPVADVALQTGVTEEACWQRLSRGRERLRERLERRGVALANTALVAALLGELAGSAKTHAAEISPQSLAPLVESGKNFSASPAAPMSKPWVIYGAIAALLILGLELAPVLIGPPEDPPKKKRRINTTQPAPVHEAQPFTKANDDKQAAPQGGDF